MFPESKVVIAIKIITINSRVPFYLLKDNHKKFLFQKNCDWKSFFNFIQVCFNVRYGSFHIKASNTLAVGILDGFF